MRDVPHQAAYTSVHPRPGSATLSGMSRPYQPPTRTRPAAHGSGRHPRGARAWLVPLLGAALALTGLSIVGTRWWPRLPTGPGPVATRVAHDSVPEAAPAGSSD